MKQFASKLPKQHWLHHVLTSDRTCPKQKLVQKKKTADDEKILFRSEHQPLRLLFFALLCMLNLFVLWALMAIWCCFEAKLPLFLDKPVTFKAKKSTFVEVSLGWKTICLIFWVCSWQYKNKELSFFCCGDYRSFWLRFWWNKKVASVKTFLLVFLSFLCSVDK